MFDVGEQANKLAGRHASRYLNEWPITLRSDLFLLRVNACDILHFLFKRAREKKRRNPILHALVYLT